MNLKLLCASLVAQLVENPPVVREARVQSLGWEDPLEKGKIPLQCSCLESSWTVHSQTRLSNFNFTKTAIKNKIIFLNPSYVGIH